MKKAVVLFSGGLDSTTVAAIAMEQGYAAYALTFDYGQRHIVEIEKSRQLANKLDLFEHRVIRLDLGQFGGSALTDDNMDVPKDSVSDDPDGNIPITYVPARNLIFLSHAVAWAEVMDASDLFIGVNIVDYSGYPDCRPAFIESFQQTANLGTRTGVADDTSFRIHAPLSGMSKGEIIQAGTALGVDYSLTHSCYDPTPSGLACGHCDSCILRKNGFEEAGISDPTRYGE